MIHHFHSQKKERKTNSIKYDLHSYVFIWWFNQGRSKSLTHIDTLDPGSMLVSRENSVDCRSEPDSTMQLAGGSQDRLAVPAMTVVPANSAGGSTGAVTSSAPMAGDSSPTDPAVRRRRLSNLYKVRARKISVNQYSHVRVSNFLLYLFMFFSICPIQ